MTDRTHIHHPQLSKHTEVIQFFNDLIIDMKLQQAGYKPNHPITPERLELASKQIQKLSECVMDDPYYKTWY